MERRRRSGQASCWTWATTTRSHSRPLDRWAVSSRTASPRTPCSARVSAGICWRRDRKSWTPASPTPRPRLLLGLRAAASKRATTESRSRWARRAAPPPARPRAAAGRASRCRTRGAQSASRWRPREGVAAGCSSRADEARAPVTAAPVEAVEDAVEEPGPADRHGGHGSRPSAWVASLSRVRSARASRRTSPASRPPSGPRSSISARARSTYVGVVEVVDVDGRPRREAPRAAGGPTGPHQRDLVAGDLDRDAGGTERAPQRRDAGAAGAHQHRHPVPRHVVLEVGAAQQVGEVLGLGPLGVVGADGHRGPRHRPGARHRGQERLGARRRRSAPGRPMRPATRWVATSSRGPNRRVVRSDTTGAGDRVGAAELGGELEDAADLGSAERVDGLVRVADHHEVSPVSGERLEQGDLAGVGVLVLVDEHVAELAPQLVAVGGRLDHRAPDQVGVVGGGLVVEVGEVVGQEQAGGDLSSGSPSRRPSATRSSALDPLLAGPGQHRSAPRGRTRASPSAASSASGQTTDSACRSSSSRTTTSCSGEESSRRGARVELGRA